MSVLTLQYECHYGMNGIMMWMTLQYEWHYSVNGTTVWMAPQNEWRHSMNDTTVLITSVNTCNCPQEITWLFLVSPGNSVQFPWQPRYRHRAEWRQADSREDGRQLERNSAVTWPHGGEHGVWGKQPVSDVMAITIMLIIWKNSSISLTMIHFVVAMGVKSGVQSTAILRRVFESRPYWDAQFSGALGTAGSVPQ